jgi:hypothetical protein
VKGELVVRGENVEVDVTRLRDECRALLAELERRAERLLSVPRALARARRATTTFARAHPIALAFALVPGAGFGLVAAFAPRRRRR